MGDIAMPKRTQDENESNEAENSEKKDNEADQIFTEQRIFTPGKRNVHDLIKHYEQMGQKAQNQNKPTVPKMVAAKKDVENESHEEQSEEKISSSKDVQKDKAKEKVKDKEIESNEQEHEESKDRRHKL